MYDGFGVDHVGIGVDNMEKMKTFYQEVLGFDHFIAAMPRKDHTVIHELQRTAPTIHDHIHFNQTAGGISIALFRSYEPVPRPIRKDFRYGDIGLSKTTIAVKDVEQLYTEMKGGINFCSQPKHTTIPELGDYHFVYCRDPENNMVEFFSDATIMGKSKFGGMRSVGMSVTDLQRSISYYQKYLGFDKVVVKTHENFSGLVDEISGGTNTQVRSCVLVNSKGGGMIELFEVMKPRGRSIPFSAMWGDFGYLQTCLYGYDIKYTEEYFRKENLEFLLKPQVIDDPVYGGMSFLYVRDADGAPIEFMTIPKPK
jgi:catechol 2,3-dioxygenase-like lactoylglutathione lyase family enzyme